MSLLARSVVNAITCFAVLDVMSVGEILKRAQRRSRCIGLFRTVQIVPNTAEQNADNLGQSRKMCM